MRIGINTLVVNRGDFGGGEKYLHFLIQHLAKVDQKNEYFIFVSPQNKSRFTISQKNFRTIECNVDTDNRVKRILYEQLFFPILLKKYRIDVFHSPNNTLPLLAPARSVVTIQFMINFIIPQSMPSHKRWYFNNLMKISARKTRKIISVSHDNKHRIIKHLKTPADKIAVVHHGIDGRFRKMNDSEKLQILSDRFGIDLEAKYILCVANNYPHKNFKGLFEAFSYIKERYKIAHKLIIAGNSGFSQEAQIWFQEARKRNPEIIHLGYLDYHLLPYLYDCADVFVFPSFCESFGLPLIEAMACGVPVVTSNIFAMPEVVGDAGLKVNPYDFKEIGEAVYSLLINKELRERLIKKGFERTKLFTWERAAKQTLNIFEGVYSNNRA